MLRLFIYWRVLRLHACLIGWWQEASLECLAPCSILTTPVIAMRC